MNAKNHANDDNQMAPWMAVKSILRVVFVVGTRVGYQKLDVVVGLRYIDAHLRR